MAVGHLKGVTGCACGCAPQYSPEALNIKYRQKKMEFGITKDSLNFSDTGKRLNLVINDKKSWQPVTNTTPNQTLKRMDDYIAKTGKLLDQMKTLAEAAKDPKLDDHDRLVLQVQMGSLQHDLTIATHTLGAIGAMEADPERKKNAEAEAEIFARNMCGSYQDSEAYKMLSRALERVANGEAWDVSEIGHRIYKYDPDADSMEITQNGLVYSRDEWEITHDKTIPTVGEILKGKGRSVMDVEAAAVTLAELENDIRDLQKRHRALAGLVEKTKDEFDAEFAFNIVDSDEIQRFMQRLVSFLDTLYRESAQPTWGDTRDEYGNTVDLDKQGIPSDMKQSQAYLDWAHDLRTRGIDPDTVNPFAQKEPDSSLTGDDFSMRLGKGPRP